MRLGSLVTVLFILSCEILFGQIDTYPIGEYKRPELHRKTLFLTGATSSSNQFVSNSDQDRSNLDLNLNVGYSSLRNDKSTQRTTSHFTSLQTDIDFEADNKANSLFTHRSIMDVKRFQPNQTFAGYAPEINVTAEYDKGVENLTKRVDVALPIGLGVGRIEIINDAWLAISILKNLREEGQLLREPTHQEITTFAEEIARIKNARVLDFRRKRIYELDEIYKHIVNINVVAENTLAFAILYDAWNYEIYDTRRSGSSGDSYISPRYIFRFNDDLFDSGSGSWSLRYRTFKPLNLHWDRNTSFEINFNSSYFTNSEITNEKEQISDNMNLTISAEYGLDYYLSRRTHMGWQNRVSLNKLFKTSREIYFVSSNMNFVHWLSPQLQIVGSLGISNQYTENQFTQTNRWNPNFSFNMQYSIF